MRRLGKIWLSRTTVAAGVEVAVLVVVDGDEAGPGVVAVLPKTRRGRFKLECTQFVPFFAIMFALFFHISYDPSVRSSARA